MRIFETSGLSAVRALVVTCAIVTPCLPAASAQGTLQYIGGQSGHAMDVSADGTVVVGWSTILSPAKQAFRWDTTTGLQDIGALAGGSARAYGVSADGSVIVGDSWTGTVHHAFRWESATGMQDLSAMGGGRSTAYDVSPDGSVVVGEMTVANGDVHAFRWSSATGMQDLGTLPGANRSVAHSVSEDGTVIVGGAYFSSGSAECFRWTAQSGMQPLGVPGIARSVSADGSIVVGGSYEMFGDVQAFRWTQQTGPERLGTVAGTPFSIAHDISADGTVIVGDCPFVIFPPGWEFRWTEGRGMQRLNSIPLGYLALARKVNADGSVVVGEVIDPAGNYRAYRWTSTQAGTRSCPPVLNSSGRGSLLNVLGSNLVASNDTVLAAEFVPNDVFGLFLVSRNLEAPLMMAGSEGLLCLGGSVGRFVGPGQVVHSGSTGTFSIALDLTAMPTPTGSAAVLPGDTWSFQAWFRDANPMPTSNFTDAISVTFE